MSNNFTFLVTDISGKGVTGLTSFSTTFRMDGAPVSGAVVSVTEEISGYYRAEPSSVPIGSGFLMLKYTGAGNYIVSPDFYDINNKETRTNDEIYDLLVQQTVTTVPFDSIARYGKVTLVQKTNDDFIERLQIPAKFRPLTGWTNLTVKAYPEGARVSSTTPPISGTYAVTVVDAAQGIIDVHVGRDVFPTSTIPETKSNVNIYADIQGVDPNSYHRTLTEITFNVIRDYNRP